MTEANVVDDVPGEATFLERGDEQVHVGGLVGRPYAQKILQYRMRVLIVCRFEVIVIAALLVVALVRALMLVKIP